MLLAKLMVLYYFLFASDNWSEFIACKQYAGGRSTLLLLVLSIAFLFIAPLINVFLSKKDTFFSSLNGFVFVIIAALVSVDIIPKLIENTGPAILPILLLGLLLPTFTEKIYRNTKVVHKVAALTGAIGLVIHTLADGAALALNGVDMNLAFSVAIHRIPIGLFVWWFIKPHFGTLTAYAMLGIIAVGTLFGFAFTQTLVAPMQSDVVAYFQAFVVGTLIHVLFHRPSVEQSDRTRIKFNQRAEGVGSLVGLLCVFYLLTGGERQEVHADWLVKMADTTLYLLLETAPMLLLAFIFAGVIKAFMPDSFVSWLKSGRALTQASKGMAVGIPLPLCSCSIMPVYHSLIKKGVPQSAAIAFLIATPEIGIDAILISLPLLGSELTVTRLICAALLAVIVALVVSKYSPKDEKSHVSETGEAAPALSFGQKFKNGMHYSIHDLLDHIAPWILVGILVAALIHPILGNLNLAAIPSALQVVVFAALGIPVYVCASSATPLVAILLINGVSPGAGLAFLLSGPSTNISTFGIISKLHNKKTALLLASSCLTTAILLGLATNTVFADFQPIKLDGDVHGFNWLNWTALIMLLSLFGYSIYRRGMRSFFMELVPHHHIGDDHSNCSDGHQHAHADGGHSGCSHGSHSSHAHSDHSKCSHHSH